ncbi:MAG TPA: hypothetical protein PL009_09225 [Flavipsychrobacter sp.]|nr:hypothetical protein [Flavipsychrobacter sp.]
MSKNEFDKLLNEKFDQHEFAYNHAGWEQLAKQLPANNSRKAIPFPWMKITGIAAALAITVSGVAWYYQSQNKEVEKIASAKQNSSQPTISQNQQSFQPVLQQEPITTPPIAHRNPSVPINNHRKQNSTPLASNSTFTPSENIEYPITTTEPMPSVTTNEHSDFKEKKNEVVNGIAQKETITNPFFQPVEHVYEPIPKQAGKTFLSLTGGMNYGSMNTGYMAGVNAKQKLGRKFFVEGDLAFVNNNTSQTFTHQQQQFATANKAPIEYKDANLVYVAFNPTVGYQVLKNVSLGVGADVQRMINGDDLLVQINEETEKTIPGTDIGLTGKTEVSLSKRLKAGVLYREGINNFVNGGSQFFDRRYLQVQLKFTVLGK